MTVRKKPNNDIGDKAMDALREKNTIDALQRRIAWLGVALTSVIAVAGVLGYRDNT